MDAKTVIAPLALAGVLGWTAGCLTTLAPNLGGDSHHAGLTRSSTADTCLACHEPEQEAMTRLRDLPPPARAAEMNEMMSEGGAALVAQWMIEDPRPCVQCHEPSRALRSLAANPTQHP